MEVSKRYNEEENEVESLRQQLQEARDTIDAIRNGEIDAIVVQGRSGAELYTLKSADQTYRLFIEKMTEGAVTLDHEGIILYSNSSFASMLGIKTSKVLARQFIDFVAEHDRSYFTVLMEHGWKGDIKGELALLKEDDLVTVQVSMTPLNMDEGISLSIIVTDLTAQKEAQRQLKIKNDQLEAINCALELSNHDLQQFASVASHDLQEPLRKIQIFCNYLKETYYEELSDMPRYYIGKIIHSASRMKGLVVDILNYSRLSAITKNFETTDLKSIVYELLEDFELTIAERKATVTVDDLPKVEVNRGQIRQVFQNLISNAIKFTKKDENPVIHIGCTDCDDEFIYLEKTRGEFCHIHVADKGIGFDEKYAKNIFNLFEKLHSKDEYEGTGIGLAITKKIIEKHNGYIKVKSQEGMGTEFIMSLPLHQNRFSIT